MSLRSLRALRHAGIIAGIIPLAVVSWVVVVPAALHAQDAGRGAFTIAQVTSYPFPLNLVAAPTGSRVAWVFNERGVRNVWVAAAPDWAAHRVTGDSGDDGQELTNLSFSHDGSTVVYVKGGDHDANWPAEGNLPPDPAANPMEPAVQIWAVPASGGSPRMLAPGDEPVISPAGDRVAFIKDHQIWEVPLDGSRPAKRMFFDRGQDASPEWSPDGRALAFVSERGDHSFIGVFVNDSTPIAWMSPATSFDVMPRWSLDGARLAFVRRPGRGGAPQTLLERHSSPWAIWVADVATRSAHALWTSGTRLADSYPTTDGEANLAWGAGDRIVFLSDMDGWPHLYSIPAAGGTPLLLTPGKYMAELISMSPDRAYCVYAANDGPDKNDDDRRHIFTVPVDRAAPTVVTPGQGVEWAPVVTGDGRNIVYIAAGAAAPPLPTVIARSSGTPQAIGKERIPADFPTTQLVVPRAVTFRAPDGTLVHGQIFERAGAAGKQPGIIFVHGGPPRQMLLGWHYMDYYSNAYAENQYLASRGYVVMSVNYRLGIGYGHDFHHPAHAGPWGASEYQDVKAGADYLRTLANVDAKRIGIWGGSYGGFLTALALARNSDIFRAGVDFHGVHDWTAERGGRALALQDQYEKADAKAALDVAWRSSPVSSMSTWASPVLLIQGDDDRNVQFHQTVDLARRLAAQGVHFEELVIPNEIHGFLRHTSWLEADAATAAFFDTIFRGGSAMSATR